MPRLREFAAIASVAMLAMSAAMLVQSGRALPGLATQPAAAAVTRTFPSRMIAVQDVARFVVPAQVSAPKIRIVQDKPPVQPDDVAERLHDVVPGELFAYFDLYLYVSKSASGPWAQHMYVFHKIGDDDLAFEESFPVSTGRERLEKYFTSTPTGLFELDPDRFDREHYSHRWHHAAMPWAMFLDYTIRDQPTGVALHSAVGHENDLGHRASGGCVRLPPEKAEELFKRIQSTEAGRVPMFAMDETGVTTDKTGRIARDADGELQFAQGYKVLLVIEDYPGAPVVVATLS